jgi:hypothetical protein
MQRVETPLKAPTPGPRPLHAVALIIAALCCAVSVARAQPSLGTGGASGLFAAPGQPEFLPVEEAYPLGWSLDDSQTAAPGVADAAGLLPVPARLQGFTHRRRRRRVAGDAGSGVSTGNGPARTSISGVVQVYYDSVELTAAQR